MKQQITRITDILFLKFLDDFEIHESENAFLDGKDYDFIISDKFRFKNWIALPSWDDIKDFVNKELFPYLKSFKNINEDYHSMKYKIWEIFSFIENRIDSGHSLKEIVEIIDSLSFQKQEDLFELSKIYEDLLVGMGNDGWNSWEFYTPRSIIKIIVEIIKPEIWQTVYDPASWSCGFLIEAFNFMRKQVKNDKELDFLNNQTFFGNEKTPLAYIMWVMNMILHGISNPNINKKNTLTTDIRSIQEKNKFDVILANPPFWWKEKDVIQQNFPIKTNATEMLFLQHITRSLKKSGKAAIVVPEWVLFNTSNAFVEIKKELLEDFNLYSVISLPAWVFLPYSWVKTNIIFFDREGKTTDIWYYEIDLWRKLTKNKPLLYDEIKQIPELLQKREISENSWTVKVENLKNFDLSAKNPNKIKEEIIRNPEEIISEIEKNNLEITKLVSELKNIL